MTAISSTPSVLPSTKRESLSPADRPCRACAHHVPAGGRLRYAVCRAPAVATNLVTGEPIYGLPCIQARDSAGRCGVEGRWWEASS